MAKLSHYDVVTVEPAGGASSSQVKRVGIILGISEEQGSDVYYAVLDLQSETTEMLPESRLAATGRKVSREDLYDGTVLKVKVDPETGRGSPSDPDS